MAARAKALPWIAAALFFVVGGAVLVAVGKSPIRIFYHLPIYPLVGYQLGSYALDVLRDGWAGRRAWALCFAVVTLLSLLRETHRTPPSGHVLWCVVLGTAMLCERPVGRWRLAALVAVVTQVVGMKLVSDVHRDPRGLAWGLAVGAVLALAAVAARRW